MDISDILMSLADLSKATKEAEEEFKNRDNSQDFSSLLQGMISSSGSKDCIMEIAPYDFAIVIVGFYSYYLCRHLEDNDTKNLYDINYSQEFSSLMFDGLSKGFDNFMLWTEVPNMVCIEPITAYPYTGKNILGKGLFKSSSGLDSFEVVIQPY